MEWSEIKKELLKDTEVKKEYYKLVLEHALQKYITTKKLMDNYNMKTKKEE